MVTLSPVTILVVNDREADLLALQAALEPLGQRILAARSAEEGLRMAQENDLALAIVDVRMPTVDGFAMVEALRRHPRHGELPVIFASALELTSEMERRVYALGAADFVPLPVRPEMLRSKVAVFVRLHRESATARQEAHDTRRTAAGKLHDAQERFRLLMDAVSDYALFFLDPAGVVTDWTISAQRLLGYSADEAIGQHFRFVFTPEDRARHEPEGEMTRAVNSGQARDERYHLRKDAALLPVTGRLVALKDAAGAIRGFAKIMRDATQFLALRDSEAKFRGIFEAGNEGIWILNTAGVIEIANRRIAAMLGYDVDELIGRRKLDFVFAEDQEYISRLFEERRAGKTQSAIEVRFRHKTGSAVWTLLSAQPLFREGRFAGALDMFADVTARRLAENKFRVFFESAAAGYALIDPTTKRFVTVNRRYCEITGRSEDELRGLTFSDITLPVDREADLPRVTGLYAGANSEVMMEKRYVRPDGTTIWVLVTTSLLRDPSGNPEMQMSVIQDITDRKRAEAGLAENRTRLRLAVELADLGVFYHDVAREIISWSEPLKQLLGMRADEAASIEALLRRVHPDDRGKVHATIQRLMDVGDQTNETETEFRIVWPDGTVRWLKANAIGERPAGATGAGVQLLGTVRDITAQKNFEGELQRQIAERTRELEEKSKQLEGFSYTIAHDLRAPLRAINGYAEYIREAVTPQQNQEVADYLERIRNSTQRLDALIKDLLAYSRITQVRIERQTVDLDQVVKTVLHELQPEIERRAAKVSVQGSMPSAVGEQSIIEQILLNLVGNALKFTVPGRSPQVEISAENGDGHVRLNVRDEGIGIPGEYQRRIFGVFERLQASAAYPGTGIGLAIVARGMDRLGGTYDVESTPGHGSTFWIKLERAHDENTA